MVLQRCRAYGASVCIFASPRLCVKIRAMNSNLTGDLIYSYDLDITGTTDFGVCMPDILGGKVKIPPQGARFDVAFAGRAMGRLSGAVRGVDYLRMRADGRIDLDIRATIETDDGARIALSADGVALAQPGNPVAELRENVSLTTASEKYAWVNARQIWAAGTVNLAAGKIHIDAGCSDRPLTSASARCLPSRKNPNRFSGFPLLDFNGRTQSCSTKYAALTALSMVSLSNLHGSWHLRALYWKTIRRRRHSNNFQRTFPADFSRTTLEKMAVSDLSGRCEQNPIPT